MIGRRAELFNLNFRLRFINIELEATLARGAPCSWLCWLVPLAARIRPSRSCPVATPIADNRAIRRWLASRARGFHCVFTEQ